MQPAAVPRPRDDVQARAHLRANVQAAAGGERHPGEWQQHAWYVPDSPGDFTPMKAPDYAELHDGLPVLGELFDRIAEVLTPDHAQVIARRALEAGQ
jgi:hypothetical protein